jgi:hypothetical protein
MGSDVAITANPGEHTLTFTENGKSTILAAIKGTKTVEAHLAIATFESEEEFEPSSLIKLTPASAVLLFQEQAHILKTFGIAPAN